MLNAPDEKGILLIEYIILIAFFTIIVTAIIKYIGLKVGSSLSTITSTLQN